MTRDLSRRLARLELYTSTPMPRPEPTALDLEVRAIVAATPERDRDATLRRLLLRVERGRTNEADAALLAACSLDTVRVVERLESSV